MKTKQLTIFFVALCILLIKTIYAQPGSIDLSFNTSDIGFGNGDGADNDVQTTSIQNDGKIIIAGNFTSYNGTISNRIARLKTNGTLDSSFNTGTGANGSIYATSIQSDGKIIIGGGFTTYNGTTINRIARLNVDGTLDASFFPGTGAIGGSIFTTSIQSDGKIIIGGSFTTYNGTTINRIARLNVDGTLDASFFPGTGANSGIYATSIQSDGKIIIGGGFLYFNGTTQYKIARLNTDGSLDTSFDPGATGTNNTVSSISIQNDGKIIIGGAFTFSSGTARNCISRLNSDGSVDVTFNPGTGANAVVKTTSIQTDGKIIIAGGFTTYNGTSRNCIARLNTDGSLDATFNPGTGASTNTNNEIKTTLIQSDGKIIIGGYYNSYNETTRNCIARINTDGSLDYTFNPGTGANASIATTKIQSDGKIIIGGNFTLYNGITRNYIARLNTDGSIDSTFNPGTGANGPIYTTSIQSDGKLIIGGNFTSYNGTALNRIARLNTDGSLDNSFNPGSGVSGINNGGIVYTTSIQSDGKIIIGGFFTLYNGATRNRIARLNTDGSLDATFNPGFGANNTIYTTSIQSDGKIVIGGLFTSCSATSRNYIARLNTDGTLDATFNPGTGANTSSSGTCQINTTLIQSDGKIIIGGEFTSYNGTTRRRVARLNTDGSLDASFNPGTLTSNSYGIYSTSIQSDGKIIIGGGFIFNTSTTSNIVRLNTNGSRDTSFNPGTGPNFGVKTTSIQNDGKIIIGGEFTSYNGIGRNRVARINGGNVVTGIETMDENRIAKVYPNPFSNNLNIEIESNNEKHNIEILNAIGQVIYNGNFVEKTTIHTSNFTPGMYLIKLENGKTFEFKKLIKK
jgi:uncharacterized delta-60 repeat protein